MAGSGINLNLIIAGSLVGSSRAILGAMHRSFFNMIQGVFGGDAAAATATGGAEARHSATPRRR